METLENYCEGCDFTVEQLRESIVSVGLDVIDTKFSTYHYYRKYNQLDVLILAGGLRRTREEYLGMFNIDIYDCISISSLAHKIMRKKGMLNGLVESQGIVREFFQKSINGGICNVNPEYKNKIVTDKLTSLDFNSMYPSALYRLYEDYGGLPTGGVKYYDSEKSVRAQCKFYFIEVNIKKFVAKKYITSLGPMIYKNGKDSIQFLADFDNPKGYRVVLSFIDFEDYIKYTDVFEYDFVQAIGWPETVKTYEGNTVQREYNDNIKLIKELYNIRLQKKANGDNVGAQLLKLLLNSIYGKTIQRPYFSSYKVVADDNRPNFIKKNYHKINEIRPCGKFKYIINIDKFDMTHSYNWMGALILSMSKRMMRELVYLGDEHDISSLYFDTDSVKIPAEHKERLVTLYRERYGKEIIGNDLGQLKFEYDSEYSVFNHKKIYYTREPNGCEHFCLKGVRQCSIRYKYGENNVQQVYDNLAQGQSLDFCLNYDEMHPSMKADLNEVRTLETGTFKRTVCCV